MYSSFMIGFFGTFNLFISNIDKIIYVSTLFMCLH
jgi:hypothetical protein